MILSILLFLLGFCILIKGSDVLIEGGISIAKRLHISSWVIGITIVGIGTSIPEFSVTFLAALKGEFDIGLGTVIGSNTFNILAILGLIAIIYPVHVKERWVRQDLTVNILAVFSAAMVAIFPIFGGNFFEITRGEGLILLVLFLVWISHEVLKNGVDRVDEKKEPSLKIFSPYVSFFMIFGGLVGVILGADWVVGGAKTIASYLGISESVIGLTIVGIGTSVPELAVSLRAARRRNYGISLGNIIGSNIFDFWGIFGVAAVFGVIKVPRELIFDFGVTLIAALILMAMMFIGIRNVLQRWQGAVMIVAYAFYLFFTL